jgi:hypothetical protein
VLRLIVTANVPSSPLRSSETSVLTRATPRNIPEDTILHSHRRENLKSYVEKYVDFLHTSLSNTMILKSFQDLKLRDLYDYAVQINKLPRRMCQGKFHITISSEYNVQSSAVFKERLSRWEAQMKMLQCNTWGFHGGDCEEWCLLGC